MPNEPTSESSERDNFENVNKHLEIMFGDLLEAVPIKVNRTEYYEWLLDFFYLELLGRENAEVIAQDKALRAINSIPHLFIAKNCSIEKISSNSVSEFIKLNITLKNKSPFLNYAFRSEPLSHYLSRVWVEMFCACNTSNSIPNFIFFTGDPTIPQNYAMCTGRIYSFEYFHFTEVNDARLGIELLITNGLGLVEITSADSN